MRKEAIYRFLNSGKTRLNVIILADHFIQALFWTGISGGIAVIILRLLGFTWANPAGWLILLFIGGITGAVTGWTKKMDLNSSAFWLDTHIGTQEVFSAYLTCMERPCGAAQADKITEKAASIIEKHDKIIWPYRNLLRRAGLTVGALLITVLLFAFLFPEIKIRPAANAEIKIERNFSGQNERKANRFSLQTRKSISRLFFPHNDRLAVRFEEALQQGDIKTLDKMVEQAKFEIQDQMKNAKTTEEQKQLEKTKERRKQIEDMLTDRNKNEEQEKNEKTARQNQETGTNSQERDKPSESNSTAQERPENNPQNGNNPSGINQLSVQGSGNPFRKNINNRKKFNAGKKLGNPALEFISTGKDARVPLSKLLPYLRKTGESAVNREDISGEYEEFIGSYFKELAKEMENSEE